MSAASPVLRGTLEESGPIEVLHDLEQRRLTGDLRFEGEGKEGVIRFFGGEMAVRQAERDDGEDPLDVFLGLRKGEWSIRAELPPLPVSKGNDRERYGSLAVHVPVDLMSYCEHGGLTGVLELTHEGRRAEAVYESGELLVIELDGRDATDLHEVFAWARGRFRVVLDHEAPQRFREEEEELLELDISVEPVERWAPAPPSKREDTRQFLRVVEMALADVIDESERARSPTRTSPPLPPPPKRRKRPKSIPPVRRKKRRDETVRLIYLTGDAGVASADDDLSTRHVHVGTGAVKEKFRTEARPERRAPVERSSMSKKRKKTAETAPARASRAKTRDEEKPAARKAASKSTDEKGAEKKGAEKEAPANPWGALAGGAAWALGVIVLGLVILAVLAKLPAVE